MITPNLIKKISNNFDKSIQHSIDTYKIDTNNSILTMINNSFYNSIKILEKNIEKNIYSRKELKYGYFPTAGDPIHWAHILTIFKILAKHSLDKIIIISAGYDERKPNLIHPNIRFPIINNALKIFEGLFELSDITLENKYATQIGENNIFHCLKRENKLISAYYIVGSDHYNWYNINKKGDKVFDTLTFLSNNIEKYKDSLQHSISAIFILRDQEKIIELETPSFQISFLTPDFSYSSTQIRKGIQMKEYIDESLYYLPVCVYETIISNKLYVDY